jgi:hypothetical protein
MVRAGLGRLIGLASVALMASSALAQATLTPGVAPDPEVVVTARPRVEARQVQKQARAITRLDDMYTAPLARFQAPVCPGIAGMPEAIAGELVDRIRYDAERAGIEVAKANSCRPNILVLFVRNGQGEFRQALRKNGYLFRDISVSEMHELAADAGPVHSWVNTATRSRDGDLLQGSEEAGEMPTLSAPMADSHIFLSTRLDITSSIVMIDIAAVNGMSVYQIADYAAMRSLARTRPTGTDAAFGTILSLFDPGGRPPPELTPFDIAYLKSLYGSLANLPAAVKIAEVTGALRKETPAPRAAPAAKQ